jgi:site-specific DNA recombinase
MRHSLASQHDYVKPGTGRKRKFLWDQVIAEFIEKDSAFQEGLSRSELNKVLKLARERKINMLIFFSSERFTRDVGDGVILRRELYRLNVKLICYYPYPREISSDMELFHIICDWQSQGYVEKLREATMRGYRGKVENRIFPSGNAPYGYRIVGKGRNATLEIFEEEAKIVRQIFEWYVVERLGTVQIANRLSELGVPTRGERHRRRKKTAPGYWFQGAVYAILRDETYAGVWYAFRYRKVGKNRV